jgi:uncharacterized phage-associated protein
MNIGFKLSEIEYKLNPQKAVEVVAMFLKLHHKPMYYLGLMKLLYMAEKLSFEKFDTPVIGDRYVSMPKGPVLSGVYDLIKGQPVRNNPTALGIWSKYISQRNTNTHEIKLLEDPGDDELCKNDEDVIREIYANKGHIDRFELVDYTHQFSEWEDPHGSSKDIFIKNILKDLKKNEAQIKLIESDIYRENYLARILTNA